MTVIPFNRDNRQQDRQILIHYIVYVPFDHGHVLIFRLVSFAVMLPLCVLRILMLLEFKHRWMPCRPWVVEKIDVFLFILAIICTSFVTAFGKANQPAGTIEAFACVPVIFPSRIRVSFPGLVLSVIVHVFAIWFIGEADGKQLMVNAVSVTFTCIMISLWLSQTERAWRENFLLRRQTDEDHSQKVRMAMELVQKTEQLSKEKSRMVSVVSHELRSPCQAISGMCNVLSSSALSDDDRECVNIIGRSADLLVAVINDFLNLSRLESDQVVLKQEPVNLLDLVEDTFDFVSATIYSPAKGNMVECVSDVSNDLPKCVMGDPERLKQVLLNLTANAAKFCERGHVSISIRFATKEEVNDWSLGIAPPNTYGTPVQLQTCKPFLLLCVADTGIGLEGSHLSRVFEEFYMVDTGPSRKYAGTGLGLAIVKRLVLLMGGSLRVHSDGKNRGSQFQILIPFLPCPLPSDQLLEEVPDTSLLHSRDDPPCLTLFTSNNEASCQFLKSELENRFSISSFGFSSLSQLFKFLDFDDSDFDGNSDDEGSGSGSGSQLSVEGQTGKIENENNNNNDNFETIFGLLDSPSLLVSSENKTMLSKNLNFRISPTNPRLSILVILDSNVVNSPDSLFEFFEHCRSLEHTHAADMLSEKISSRTLLRFKFVYSSPAHDHTHDLLSLNALGYFSKLPKPWKRSGICKLIKKVIAIDRRSETWQPKIFGPTASSMQPHDSSSSTISSQPALFDLLSLRRKTLAPEVLSTTTTTATPPAVENNRPSSKPAVKFSVASDTDPTRRQSTPDFPFTPKGILKIDARRTSIVPWDVFAQSRLPPDGNHISNHSQPPQPQPQSPQHQQQSPTPRLTENQTDGNWSQKAGGGMKPAAATAGVEKSGFGVSVSGASGGPVLLQSDLQPILIVDDNIINQQVFSRMLRSVYSCDIASDGAEAVQLVGEKLPNGYKCVLMDFHMVRMDGITATRKIRARGDQRGRVPIIGLSADSQAETQEQAFDAGMNMYLTKPIKKDELLKAIQQQIQKHAQ